MKYVYSILLSLLFVTFLAAYAQAKLDLEIVYPKNHSTINAPSTFFVGNTDPKAKLTIDSNEVKVFPNGGFVQVISLKEGVNTVTVRSVLDDKEKIISYVLKVPKKPETIPKEPLKINALTLLPNKNFQYKSGDTILVKFQGSTGNKATFSIGEVKDIPMTELPAELNKKKTLLGNLFNLSGKSLKGIYTGVYTIQDTDNFKNTPILIKLSSKGKCIVRQTSGKVSVIPKSAVPQIGEVTKDNAVVRISPDGGRLTPLMKGIRLFITGRMGNDYRFQMGQAMEGWISAGDIKLLPSGTPVPESFVTSVDIEPRHDDVLIKIPLSQQLPVSIDQLPGPQMILNIYGAQGNINVFPYNPNDTFIKEIKWLQSAKNTFQLIIIPNSSQFWGYNYYYEDNNLILRLKKPFLASLENPLKDKIITIDPGHGGAETGSVGPTGIPEKTVNLAISKFLKENLERSGARVIMTRNSDDENPGLYERSEIANNANSQILLSIHNNALPDGNNPYKTHGSSTYYYHSQSLPLAKTLQEAMTQNLGLKNLGIFWDSLALTRPTQTISVLVEVGFMIHPDEYAKLIDKDFQKKAADSLAIGLEDFFKKNIICN